MFAQNNIGWMYAKGQSVPRDLSNDAFGATAGYTGSDVPARSDPAANPAAIGCRAPKAVVSALLDWSPRGEAKRQINR
jgi:hypothetical protein